MVTKLKITALILLIVIEIVGCIGEKREIPTNSVSIGTPSEYKVEYWPVTENDTAYIMIVVRGGTEFMEIIPLDPTITIHQGRGLLSEEDAKDVCGLAMITIGTYDTVHLPRSYVISIKESSSGIVVGSTTLSVTGPIVFIHDVEFDIQQHDMSSTMTFQVINQGDTVAQITKAMVWIDWYDVGGRPGESPIEIYHYKKMEIPFSLGLQPKEFITENISLPSMDAGMYNVRITLYSEQKEIAYYTTQLVLKR